MLDHSTRTLLSAYDGGWAVAAFSTYSIELTSGVLRAAEQLGTPVIIQAGSSAFRYAGRDALAAATVAAARQAAVRVGVHLDHCRDLQEIEFCIAAGYTSVMVDGSHLSFEQNVALTRSVIDRAHDAGVWVEAELGSIAGDEDASGRATAKPPLTDVDQAGEFVDRTGVDCLAVAIGNVHGYSARPAELDLGLLADIRAACAVPLVLHGASGVPDAQLLAAIELGVAKVNINTELRKAFIDHLDQDGGIAGGYALADVTTASIRAVATVAVEKSRLLSVRGCRPVRGPIDR